jgi:hypothetical protein
MKEHPIIFSGEMVRAILDGRKTMTRRVMKQQPIGDGLKLKPDGKYWEKLATIGGEGEKKYSIMHGGFKCPYEVGGKLWVRETWNISCMNDVGVDDNIPYTFIPREWHEDISIHYKADEQFAWWRSPIHMPRWASRILLEVTNVRVERLQEISEADAMAEGCLNTFGFVRSPENEYDQLPTTAKNAYRELWDKLNGNSPRGFGWDTNCWVWVVSFRQVETKEETA